MKIHWSVGHPLQLERGCVVLDQPQRFCRSMTLRLVCNPAALHSFVFLLLALATLPAPAATQVGSAP